MTKREEIVRRYCVFLLGLCIMALAVAVMAKGALGISPVQSACYVIYRRFPEHVTLGTLVFSWNCILLLLQVIIRGKSFRWINIIQIPLSSFLGIMVDLFGGVLSFVGLAPATFIGRIVTMLCGLLILAFSISITVAAQTVMNPGEALVAAIADKIGRPFGRVKVAADLTFITIAVVLSFVLFGEWRADIIGLGTVVSASVTGFLVGMILPSVRRKVDQICTPNT